MTASVLIYQIKDLYFYSEFCLTHSESFVSCSDFWSCFYFSAAFIVFLFWCFLLKKYFRDRREWQDFKQRLIDRQKVAEPEVMAKYRWNGEY